MKKLLPLLCVLPLHATELSPYFSPVWEPYVRMDYLYQYMDRIESPLGSFNLGNPINNAGFAAGLTVWPQWSAELELLLSSNPATDVSFSYQATRLTGRYQFFDEACGDLFSIAGGVTLFTVRSSFLTATSCWFHGNFNSEFHLTIGKECLGRDEWWLRFWAYGGFGVANKGNPWWHNIVELDFRPTSSYTISPMMELVYGTGDNSIHPLEPFPGYAGINHQFVNIGLALRKTGICLGTFSLNGWYNVHARNFPESYYGVGATWLIPIGI